MGRPAMKDRLRRISVRALQVMLGVAVGLGAAEGAFCYRDRGAFPHLNVYAPDPGLGVRLRPGARQRVAFSGNPLTSVRINRAGFRGGELMSPGPDDVLVVGDSQVFGLGVEESETFAAQLAARTKRAVINAGVPTYGPLEFQALLEEELPRRKPRTVLYVVNMANDLLEVNRPNVGRHVVWDGWAVRRETAPTEIASFPGRGWLFRESHLVFSIRRFFHERSGVDDLAPVPSEGSWRDLVVAADGMHEHRTKEEIAQLAAWEADVKKAVADAAAAQDKLQTDAQAAFPEVFWGPHGREYLQKKGHPGDIVSEQVYHSEAFEGPTRRVRVAMRGAKIRLDVEALLRARAEDEIEKAESKAILAGFEERAKLEKKIATLRQLPHAILRAHTPLYPALERVKKLCDAHAARLVVVVLPMDVQVSPDEWSKYGEPAVDLAATRVLSDDIVRAGQALAVSVLDLTAPLAAAEPGAFLHRDLHMSAKGHAAVAAFLARELDTPPPPAAHVTGPALGFARVCACHKQAGGASCADLDARPDIDCVRTHADCKSLLACVGGDPDHKPTCLPGWVNHGPLHRCREQCGIGDTCHFGKCTLLPKEQRLCL